MFLDDLITDGGKVLGLNCRNAASQIEESVRQRLQDDFITSLYESDTIAFLEIQRAADCPWNSHLPSASYGADNCHTFPPSVCKFHIRQTIIIIPVKSADVKRQMSRCMRIVTTAMGARICFSSSYHCVLSFHGVVIPSHTERTAGCIGIGVGTSNGEGIIQANDDLAQPPIGHRQLRTGPRVNLHRQISNGCAFSPRTELRHDFRHSCNDPQVCENLCRRQAAGVAAHLAPSCCALSACTFGRLGVESKTMRTAKGRPRVAYCSAIPVLQWSDSGTFGKVSSSCT
jgi:hypothetical protein